MEREDIVLKNLAQEIRFSKHEFIRLNKLDQKRFKTKIELLDFDKVDGISERLMLLLHEENPITTDNSRIPYGNILLKGNFSIESLIDLTAKAFKTGNKVAIQSDLITSNSYQFINKAWQSVLASQGYDSSRIQFIDLEKSFDLKADFFIESISMQNGFFELEDFTMFLSQKE